MKLLHRQSSMNSNTTVRSFSKKHYPNKSYLWTFTKFTSLFLIVDKRKGVMFDAMSLRSFATELQEKTISTRDIKMGVAETLGIIFAAFMILGGIALAVWFYAIRQPTTAVTGKPCTKDAECSRLCTKNEVGCTVFDEYQGEKCINKVCKSVDCQSNATCANKLPGSTCFGYSPTTGEESCVPLACVTTNDCVSGGDPTGIDVVCVYKPSLGNGVCVPTKPSGDECYKIDGLTKDSAGNCVVCASGADCPFGSSCEKGRCLRCGNTGTNLCSKNPSISLGAGAWGFCEKGGGGCQEGVFTCTDKIDEKDIVFPDGSSLTDVGPNIGLCLPIGAECAFSWFNTDGSLDGPANVGGRCASAKPYCSASGKCVLTPIGALCGQIPGIPSKGIVKDSTGQITYDLTGICTGRLVAPDVFSSPSDFTSNGTAFVSGQTCLGNKIRKKKNSCKCETTTDPKKVQCPKGTFCQPFTTSNTQNVTINSKMPGICLISSGTGVFVPRSENLGHFYADSACVPNIALNGIPTCATFQSRPQAPGGPGAFCYTTDQCLYQGKRQGTNSTLGALMCVNNRCVGGFVPV